MERGSRSNTESPYVFPLCCTGSLQVVQTPPSSTYPLKVLWGGGKGGAGQGQTKTFASVNSHVRLETEQALYGFLTSHPLTLESLMDTSGGSLFRISHRSVWGVFCRLSASLGSSRSWQVQEVQWKGRKLSPSNTVWVNSTKDLVALTTVGLWVSYSQHLRGDSPP